MHKYYYLYRKESGIEEIYFEKPQTGSQFIYMIYKEGEWEEVVFSHGGDERTEFVVRSTNLSLMEEHMIENSFWNYSEKVANKEFKIKELSEEVNANGRTVEITNSHVQTDPVASDIVEWFKVGDAIDG